MVNSVAVCGAGTMGRGIAQIFIMHHIPTVLFDVNSTILKEAEKNINHSLQMLIQKNKLERENKEKINGLLRYSSDIKDCHAELTIEAIVENLSVKQELFAKLASINSNESIFATNTSSLSVTSIAEKIPEKKRFIGMHFFNPPTLMKLVEVVTTTDTSPQTTDTIISICKYLGKTPVICKDAPGFIVNHVARPFYLEALRILESGNADSETIDALLEATGFRMGPFRLMDLIGNDINYAVSTSVYEALGKPGRLKPSIVQQKKVEKGELGRKSGKGYYEY